MYLRELTTRAGVAAALTIAWAGLLMSALKPYPFPHIFPHDIDSPVLALELSHGEGDIAAVLHRQDKSDKGAKALHIMRLGNVLDLVFIPIYAFFLWALARVFADRVPLLTCLIVGTALFDYIEDWQIFRALNGANPAIYIPSLIKWGLLGLTLLFTAVLLFRSASPVYSLPTKRLLGMGYLLSGGLIVLAVALGPWIGYSYIELGIEVFALLVIVNVVGLLGPHFTIAGVSPKYVENFCQERKTAAKGSLTAMEPERRG
jgi:hypothetical protein